MSTTAMLSNLKAVEVQNNKEKRAALKKKLHVTLANRRNNPLVFKDSKNDAIKWAVSNHDTSGNEAVLHAERRSFIREHIAKVDILKELGVENIPTFAEVWSNYIDSDQSETIQKNDEQCTTTNCACDTKHV